MSKRDREITGTVLAAVIIVVGGILDMGLISVVGVILLIKYL